ncbi:MAG: hypothetical protein HYZ57_09750 [Acidobacteria bacterium]|nr:hypothetical protein [Acidobacteriota bacterium]MBI3280110.1 hypothetical protein [Acidobacteriota bacterium]
MAITVEQIDEARYKVTVVQRTTTTHTVTMAADYWRKLTGGRVPPGKLVEKSFEFLLDREPNTSILRSFDLPVIQRYFPDYERIIRSMLE